jgi:ABC-type phosphate/phosphonate transport system substrate-binding protein
LDSNTGMNLLRAAIAPLAQGKRFFSNVIVSGSHRQSLRLIAAGSADIAAIDCVTLALLQRIEPQRMSLIRVLAWSPAAPGLPLITSARTDAPTLRALRLALDDIANDAALSAVRAELLLQAFESVPLAAYARVQSFETETAALGYPQLW